MNSEKYIKKNEVFSLIFIMIGIIAGITGFLFDFQKDMMQGITIGFLPTGILMLIILKYTAKKPKYKRNMELEMEERNVFINTKAGHTAFWISYWYIFIWVILYNVLKISFLNFLILTLILMPIAYFTLVVIYHKKY